MKKGSTTTDDKAVKIAILRMLNKGEAFAISNREIRKRLAAMGVEVRDGQMRTILKEMREQPIDGAIILACSDGYYLDSSGDDVLAYMKHLRDRIEETKATLEAIQRSYMTKYQKAPDLFLDPVAVKKKLQDAGCRFQGEGVWWHASSQKRIIFRGSTLGFIKSIYDDTPYQRFDSVEQLVLCL